MMPGYFLTICKAIKLGGEHFHFMWGQYDYKTALLGVQRDQYREAMYRSPLSVVRHAGLALHTAGQAARLEGKRWLLAKSTEDSRSARLLRKTIAQVKAIRQMLRSRRLKASLEAHPVSSLAES